MAFLTRSAPLGRSSGLQTGTQLLNEDSEAAGLADAEPIVTSSTAGTVSVQAHA